MPPVTPDGFGNMSQRVRTAVWAFALLAPSLALFGVFRVYSLGTAIYLSFTTWDGFSSPEWVGTANFRHLYHDQLFIDSLSHSLVMLLAVPVWVVVPFLIASFLADSTGSQRFFRVALLIPAALSPVVLGAYYNIALDPSGPLNTALRGLGLGFAARAWLNDPRITLWVVVGVTIWATLGIGVLIFLAGFANVDHDLVDAARVDGAGWWSIKRYIVFQQLRPVFELWTVLVLFILFTSMFPLVYSLTSGGPGFATYTPDYFIYVEGFTNGKLGYATAAGVVLLVVVSVGAGLAILLMRRGVSRR